MRNAGLEEAQAGIKTAGRHWASDIQLSTKKEKKNGTDGRDFYLTLKEVAGEPRRLARPHA